MEKHIDQTSGVSLIMEKLAPITKSGLGRQGAPLEGKDNKRTMEWIMLARRWNYLSGILAVTALLFVGATGCSDDDSGSRCELGFTSINGAAAEEVSELTSADDQDSAQEGFQIDVVVSAGGVGNGKELTLSGGDEDMVATVTGEEATFTGYTIPVDLLVNLQVTGPDNCTPATKSLLVRTSSVACTFVGRENGEMVSCSNPGDDSSTEPGLQMDFTFSCTDVEDGNNVTLLRDGDEVDSQTLAMGSVTFEDVFLVGGGSDCQRTVQLQAIVETSDGTELVPLGLDAECCDSPSCEIVGYLPEEPVQGLPLGLTFNRSTDADTFTQGMQTQLGVHTDSSRVWKVGVRVTSLQTHESEEYFVEGISADEVYVGANPIDLPEGNVMIEPLCVIENETEPFTYPDARKMVYVDTVPPECPVDLTCEIGNPRVAELNCEWTTPDDPGVDQDVWEWDFRYSDGFDEASECTASALEGQWQGLDSLPGSGDITSSNYGALNNNTFQPLNAGLKYCVGTRVVDYAGNVSDCVSAHWTGKIEVRRSWLSPCAAGEYCAFGTSVTSVDLNCDGYKDIVVGAPEKRQTANDTGDGQVYVYFGGMDGVQTNASPDLIIRPNLLNSSFGSAVAGIGNFTGHDGPDAECEDLFISAAYYDYGGQGLYSGAAFIYKGRPQWTSLEFSEDDADMAVYYDEENRGGYELFGIDAKTVGDFNNDGNKNLFVGSPYSGTQGAVFGFQEREVPYSTGTPIVISATQEADFVIKGASSLWDFADGFGASVSPAGDLDGDGYSDLIVGAPGWFLSTGTGPVNGSVYIVFGGDSNDGTSLDVTSLDVTNPGNRITKIVEDDDGNIINTRYLGRKVAGQGDLNGDGFLDIAVSDPRYGGDVVDATEQYGAVYIFFGNSSGFRGNSQVIEIDEADIWIRSQAGGEDRFGIGLGISVDVPGQQLGDFNNDGLADLFVGAAAYSGYDGSVFFLYGDTGLVSSQNWIDWNAASFWLNPPAPCGRWGEEIGWAGDINGDGYSDVIVGDFFYPHICDENSEWRGRIAVLF